MLKRLKSIADAARCEVRVLRLVLRHRRTPLLAKLLLALAIAYLLLPFDLIPDWIPVLGQLDDIVIVPGLVWLAFRVVPREVLAECRKAAAAAGNPGESSRQQATSDIQLPPREEERRAP